MTEDNSMTGIDAKTGKHLSGLSHLQQSISDILRTPIGSRIHRRDYGSRLHELVDLPLNDQTRVLFYAAVAEALDKWEPRLRVDRMTVVSVQHGQITLKIVGYYRHNGEEITLDGILVNA